MSLINDVLRQAKQSQQNNPPPPLQFRPGETRHRRRRPRFGTVLLVASLTLTFLAGTALLLMVLLKSERSGWVVAARTETPSNESSLNPIPPGTSTSLPRGYITSHPAVTPPIETTAPAVTEPAPKLQGIFYNPNHPSALVDGKAVFVGDEVGSLRVAEITRTNVTLAGAARPIVLSLSP